MKSSFTSEKAPINKNNLQVELLNEIQIANLVGSWEWLPGTGQYFWSDSMFFLHGLLSSSDNQIKIDAANKFIHPDDRIQVQDFWEELQKTGIADARFRIIIPDHKIKQVHAHGIVMLNDDGRHFFRGSFQEVKTELEQYLVDEIHQQEIHINILERAEEIAMMGTWQINLSSFDTFYSDNIFRLYGLAPGSLNAHVDTFVQFIHPEDKHVVMITFERSYQEKIPIHIEYRIIRNNEEERYIKQVSSVIKNEKGEQVLIGTTHDITEKKWLELALQHSYDDLKLQHKLFQQAEQIGSTGTWQINVHTKQVYYSDNIYAIHGLKPRSVIPTTHALMAYIHPDDRQPIAEATSLILDGHTTPLMEYRIIRNDGKIRTLRQITKQTINSSGEQLIIGVVQDITEQHATKMQFKEINEKLLLQNESFAQAEKLAAIGNWFWNLATDEVYYSENIYHIHGVKPGSIPDRFESLIKFVYPHDREVFEDILRRIKDEEPVVENEYRIILPNGELRHIRYRNKLITSPEGQKIVIGSIHDISHEIELKKQLSERIDFAEILSDSIIDLIVVTDSDNNIITCNQQCEKILRFKKQDVFSKNIFKVFQGLKNAEMIENFRKAMQGKTITIPAVQALLSPGYHDLLIRPFRNNREEIVGVFLLLHDVTQEFHLHQQLKERLGFIELLVESSSDRIMALDSNLNYTIWNKNCEKYFGIKKQDILGKNVHELFPMFKVEPIYQNCKKVLKGETVIIPGKEDDTADNNEHLLLPIKNENNQVTGILWILHDHTDLMEARQKLTITQNHLRTAQEMAHLGSWEYDLVTGILSWSDEIYRMHGYEPGSFEPVKDFYISTSHTENRNDIEKLLSDNGMTHTFINKIYTLDGRLRYIQTKGSPVSDGSGKTLKMVGTMQDITEQKLLKDQLEKKAKAIRNQYEHTSQLEIVNQVSTWQWNMDSGRLFWSENLFRILGYPPRSFEPNLEKLISFVHPEDKEIIFEATERIKNMESGTIPAFEYRIMDKNGKIKYLRTDGRVIKNNLGTFVSGTIHDVTDYILLQHQLSNNDMLLQKIIDSSNESISIFGQNLYCLMWNKRSEEMYGKSKVQATGKYLFEIIPQLNQEKTNAIIQQLMRKEEYSAGDKQTIQTENLIIEFSRVAYGNENAAILVISKYS